jgi:hypothetical protein
MRALIYMTSVVTLLGLNSPAVAQQDTGPKPAKHSARISKPPPAPETIGQGGYYGYCGQWFGCYTGIPLRCAENTRPYQNIANHECLCVHNGCPQQ